MKRFVLSALMLWMCASAASAQVVDCNITQRSWAGIVTEWYSFDLDMKKTRITVSDAVIRFVDGKPLKAEVESLDENEARLRWSVKKLPTDETRGGDFVAVLNIAEKRLNVEAKYSDGGDAGTGKGICFDQ
ncbi:hypothetical protein NBRC116590_03730 [Pelagimonas sp. KU-00592-HH]|uniref:hypothetical protein n=1 Tax=Pelagimonas sp. KU-00592-HH TaxID=3127651 RepID=UPI0031073792